MTLLKKQSTKKWWEIGLTAMVLVSAACEQPIETPNEKETKEEIFFVQRDIFSEQEQQFIEAYNEILATTEITDSVLENAPSDPSQSDFAIIMLPEEVYGTPAFSFLPLISRELTRNELMQLASAYGYVSPETILQDYCSYKQGECLERGISENRQLSRQEYFEANVELFSQYMAEGKRPEHKSQHSAEEGDPLLFDAFYQEEGRDIQVWIYPRDEMTQEQVLQLIDLQCGDLPESVFTPKDGQLTKTEAEEQVKWVMSNHITDATMDKMYLYYVSYDDKPAPVDQWYAFIHMKDGGHDYSVCLAADDGELTAWRRRRENYYTEDEYGLRDTDSVTENTATEKQVLKAAEDYLERYMGRRREESENLSINAQEGTVFVVRADVKGEKWYIYVDGTDLSINGLEIPRM